MSKSKKLLKKSEEQRMVQLIEKVMDAKNKEKEWDKKVI